LIWNANKSADDFLVGGQYVQLTSEMRSSLQYQTLVFCFAAVAAWLHYFTSEKDANGRIVWRYLYYGFLFFASVVSYHSWQNMDFNRHFYDSDTGFFKADDANKRLFGGEVLAYGGLFLLGIHLNGAFKSRGFCTVIFFLAAVAFNVVGSVILWKLDNTQIDANSSDRTTVFEIAVSQWVTLFILAGAVFHENIDGAVASFLAWVSTASGSCHMASSSRSTTMALRVRRPGLALCSAGSLLGLLSLLLAGLAPTTTARLPPKPHAWLS